MKIVEVGIFIIGVMVVLAIVGFLMKGKPKEGKIEVGYKIVEEDADVKSEIKRTHMHNGNLIIEYEADTIPEVEGLPESRYGVTVDSVVIFDYDKDYFRLIFGATSDIYEFGDPPETMAYTPSSETHCSNGKCTLSLYSGVRYVYEDDKWKHIKEAKSLKGYYNKVYLEKDEDYEIEIEEFNYTYVKKIKLKSEVEGHINFSLDGVNYISPYFEAGGEIELEDIYLENILAYNFTLGASSTTIQLQDADSENLEDVDIWDVHPFAGTRYDSRIFIKFNLSKLQSDVTITDVVLYLNQTSATGQGKIEVNVSRMENQTWIEEEDVVGLYAMTTNYTNSALNLTESIAYDWQHWNVTNIVIDEYNLNSANMSFHFHDNSDDAFSVGTDSTGVSNHYMGVCSQSGDFGTEPIVEYYTKEQSISRDRPYLNITYTAAAPPDSCTYSSGNWEVDCSDNCEIGSDTDIGGNDLIFTGSGTIHLNADVATANVHVGSGCTVVFAAGKKMIVG